MVISKKYYSNSPHNITEQWNTSIVWRFVCLRTIPRSVCCGYHVTSCRERMGGWMTTSTQFSYSSRHHRRQDAFVRHTNCTIASFCMTSVLKKSLQATELCKHEAHHKVGKAKRQAALISNDMKDISQTLPIFFTREIWRRRSHCVMYFLKIQTIMSSR